MGAPGDRPLSAIPSRKARALAFVAILVAGGCGALIGRSFVSLQCDDCTAATGLGAIVGGLVAAGGVAVVAVLVLRAMGEWRRLEMPEADDVGPGGDVGDGGDEGRSGRPGLSP
ncbi:MAG: hypothetical protein ACRD0N_03730 [Acidimicrobiales bacterium]